MIFAVEDKPLARVLPPVIALAAAAGAGLAFFVAALVRPPDLPVDTNPAPLAGHNLCAAVVLSFSSDEKMWSAARSFHDDPKARRVFVETAAEAYPASPSVSLLAVPGTDLRAWAQELHVRFRDAETVSVTDLDAAAAQLNLTAPPPKCPREGEY
ncbi:hypothetical protein ABJI51_00905 [Amycolatopsis sp. NEAU-NG30]|uniref:FtsX extracellular domain-containing protein n=1 Tax=Amycolatopsis melonis TaxID=3156488 RepID=A0ABV0L5N1_9PSEU